jgi:hypothetical protein
MRVPVSQAALVAQFQLQQRMVAGLGTTYEAVNYLDALTAAIANRKTAAAGTAGAAEITAAIQTVEAAIAPLESGPSGFGPAHRDLGRRINDQVVGDQPPTASIIAGVDAPCHAIDASIAQLRTLQASQIAPLNALLSKAGLAALPTWAPPASGCQTK